jgi:hypothetical protein
MEAEHHSHQIQRSCPDLNLQDVDGGPVQLFCLWKRQVHILVFSRHSGCPQCKEMMDL